MKRTLKTALFVSLIAVGITTICLSSYSVAAFLSRRKIDQGIKADGKLGVFVYLDASEWENEGDPIFKMRVWNTDGTKTVRYISPKGKTGTGKYVFDFKSTEYNRMMFLRCNPNAPTSYFEDGADCFKWYGETDTTKVLWNKTGDLEYNSSTPLYTITSYGSEKFYTTDATPKELGTISFGVWSALS